MAVRLAVLTGLAAILLLAGVVKFANDAKRPQPSSPQPPPRDNGWTLRIATRDGRYVQDWRLNESFSVTSQGKATGFFGHVCEPTLNPEELRVIAEAVVSTAEAAWPAGPLGNRPIHACITNVSLTRREGGIEREYNAFWTCPGQPPPSVSLSIVALYDAARSLRTKANARCKEEEIRAIAALEQEARLNPDAPDAHEKLGDLYAAAFDHQKAVEAYQRLARLKPASAEAHHKLAEECRAADRVNEATEAYNRVLRLNPPTNMAHDTLNALGSLHAEAGQYRQAAAAYERLLSIGTKDEDEKAWTHYQLAELYFKLRDYRQALEEFEVLKNLASRHMWGLYGDYVAKGLRVDPKNADLNFALGNAHYYANAYEKAIEPYKRTVQLDPKNDLAYSRLGYAYKELGRYPEAISAFERAIALEPDYINYNNLGVAFNEVGKHEDAIRALAEAVRLEPEDSTAHYNIGLAYAGLKRWTEAVASYNRALDRDAKDAGAHFNLAKAYLAIGNRAAAGKEHEILKSLDVRLAEELRTLLQK